MRDLTTFYRSVLRRISNSKYEKEVSDHYIEYLKGSQEALAEPFLIPELRYAGLKSRHRYRLDFSVLNPHMMTFTGFELSPHSTHLAVKGTRGKTQQSINAELAEKWEHEMTKRNRYFTDFGITTVTFTDSDLRDIEACFGTMAKHLASRPQEPISLDYQTRAIETLELPNS